MNRQVFWLIGLIAVLAYVGVSSPGTAQRAPRFLFPGLAAAGAALVAFSFVIRWTACDLRIRYGAQGSPQGRHRRMSTGVTGRPVTRETTDAYMATWRR